MDKIIICAAMLRQCSSLLHVQVVEQALKDADMQKDAIDFLVLHQANQRILDSAAQRLGVPSERVVSNLAGESPPSAALVLLLHVVYLRSPSNAMLPSPCLYPGVRVTLDDESMLMGRCLCRVWQHISGIYTPCSR